MIRTLNIHGFKSIQEASVPLGRLNCFIGANGVGKSNVLEALGVLGAAANGVADDESLLRRAVCAQGEAFRVSLPQRVSKPEAHTKRMGVVWH